MTTPEMPSTFFNAEFFDNFTFYVKWFMSYNMPIFMICMAIVVAYLVADMIIESVQTARDEHDKKDDDDIETRYY